MVVQSPSIRNGWRSPTPLLMIANGGHDPYHALEEAQSAYAKAGEPKRCPTTCSACTPGRARSRLTALSDGLSRRGAPILHYRF
ncbi:hypothetical protein ACIBKY_05065 [Nonomuraea sp. NPDC050394]|uniref:hypothetical protein n=1 Tax=Nonomuraea sp. NPDC050394 TaxID=3364363 RepID=UPI0037AEA1A4